MAANTPAVLFNKQQRAESVFVYAASGRTHTNTLVCVYFNCEWWWWYFVVCSEAGRAGSKTKMPTCGNVNELYRNQNRSHSNLWDALWNTEAKKLKTLAGSSIKNNGCSCIVMGCDGKYIYENARCWNYPLWNHKAVIEFASHISNQVSKSLLGNGENLTR